VAPVQIEVAGSLDPEDEELLDTWCGIEGEGVDLEDIGSGDADYVDPADWECPGPRPYPTPGPADHLLLIQSAELVCRRPRRSRRSRPRRV